MTADIDSIALINGVDLTNDEVYAAELGSVASIVNATEGDFWEAATRDALTRQISTEEYLQLVETRLQKFRQSAHVTDRDLATIRLKKYTELQDVHILLGGKSTGKTKLLKKLCLKYGDDHGAMLVYVNGRGASLSQGLKSALDEITIDDDDDSFWNGFDSLGFLAGVGICASASVEGFDLATGGALGSMAVKAAEWAGGGASAALKKLAETVFLKAPDPTEGLIQLLLKVAESKGQSPCLIIDEANLVISGASAALKKLIGMILKVTKEETKMSCILCSSQHSYPKTLERSGLQLDLADIVFLPELSPQAMWHNMTKEKYPGSNELVVGMGEHLAKHIISVCGGRIAFAGHIVTDLRLQKQSHCVNDRLYSVEGANKINKMLKPGKQSDYRERLDENGLKNLVKLLNDMSKHGYCKIPPTLDDSDTLIDILVNDGVAGLVQRSHFLHKDWKSVFGLRDNQKILVPSSASLRLVIAAEMKNLNVSAPSSPLK